MGLAPWERITPPEYYGASDFEKYQWVFGVPPRYWNVKPASVKPATFQYVDKKKRFVSISDTTQLEYLKERMAHPDLLERNKLAIFTSTPTDDHAMAAACAVINAYLQASWNTGNKLVRVRVDDIQDYEKAEKLGKDFFPSTPSIFVLSNLNDNSSRERLSLTRDLVQKYEGAFRIVVAACENPLTFARERIFVEPDEVYHFDSKLRKVSVR